MIINEQLLDEVSRQAQDSPRLRMAMELRNTPEDQSQRMLNALEPGTVMPIHRHLASSETVALLRGKIRWYFYDENGNVEAIKEACTKLKEAGAKRALPLAVGGALLCATDPNTDMGRIAEDNGYGYWCESNSVEAFSAILDKMIHSDRKSMGEKGFDFLKANYLVENTYNAIMKHLK